MRRVGIYRLERELDCANASVRRYACVHERTGRRATITLRAQLSERSASKLLRRARAWARVAHPSINAITDMGVTEGGLYCVTSGREGARSLESVLGAGRLRDPLRTLMPVVHAMALAHAEGARHGALDATSIELVREGEEWTARLIPHCTVGRARRRDDVRAMANLIRRCTRSRRANSVLSRASTMTMLELYEGLIAVSPASVRRRMDAISGARDELVSSGTTSLQRELPRSRQVALPRTWGLPLAFVFLFVTLLTYWIVRSWLPLGFG